jgi:ParB family transcriptional regulator, chromosome partitioning protein
MNTLILLAELHAGNINVRKTGGMSIDALAASITAHGLLHNLVVTRAPVVGGYIVVAGGRRLRALQALDKAGALPAPLQSGIPCQVIEHGGAHEASLAENVMRQAMHPADEFDAFAALAAEGLSISEIAARFGQTDLFVKQRLKLANVAPEILDEYRAGNATLEQMVALALTDDTALQVRLWKAAKNEWQREPDRLRRMITEKESSTDSRLGKFVGLAAYEKAGGAVRRDLFAPDGEAYIQDLELLAQLAQAKLDRSAEKVLAKEGWLWAEGREKFDYSDERAFGEAPSDWKGSKQTWTADVKATAGVVVTIGYNGQTEIKRGLVRAQDRKAATTAAGGTEVKGGKKVNVPGELSFAAVQRLQAEATGILQAEVAEQPRTALALLAAELAGRALYECDYRESSHQRQWVHIQREHSGRMPGNLRDIIPQSSAGKLFAESEKAWQERVPKKKAELRAWVLAQDAGTVESLLAFLVARELDLVDVTGDQKQGCVDLAMAAQVDFSRHWTPTEEWLATLPKAVVIAMVTDAAGATAAAALGKLKRDQIPHAAIGLLPAGWLPPTLRRPRPVKKAKAAKTHSAAAIADPESSEMTYG